MCGIIAGVTNNNILPALVNGLNIGATIVPGLL